MKIFIFETKRAQSFDAKGASSGCYQRHNGKTNAGGAG
jgi:hypothetical protein